MDLCGRLIVVFSRMQLLAHHPNASAIMKPPRKPKKTVRKRKASNTARIKLSKGMFAIIDREYFDRVSAFKWHASHNGKNGFIAKRTIYLNGNSSGIYMHRFIMNSPKGMVVDHINHNQLDNKKENLRICTLGENNCNTRRKANKYKGVHKRHPLKKWSAKITYKGNQIALGVFKTAKAGAIAYNEAAKKYHGEFACLNKI